MIVDPASDDMTNAQRIWQNKYLQADMLMRARRSIPKILIEVAAQHPLVDGLLPNAEFAARLDRAIVLYGQYQSQELQVEIYVPGSRHMHDGRADQISLSRAGVNYLTTNGIPPECMHGEDLNKRYKGDAGVYGSADECFVAASYFKDSAFGLFASILSPMQLTRKMVHYIEFGVIPLAFTAPTDDPYHDFIDELFIQVPHAMFVDSRLQGDDSRKGHDLRMARRPKN